KAKKGHVANQRSCARPPPETGIDPHAPAAARRAGRAIWKVGAPNALVAGAPTRDRYSRRQVPQGSVRYPRTGGAGMIPKFDPWSVLEAESAGAKVAKPAEALPNVSHFSTTNTR